MKKYLAVAKAKIVKYEPVVAGALLLLTGSIVLIQRKGLVMHNEFLIEKGLYEEFYSPEGN